MTQNINVSYTVSAPASVSDIVASLSKKYVVSNVESVNCNGETEYSFELSHECYFVKGSAHDWYSPDEYDHVEDWVTEEEVLSDVESAFGVSYEDYYIEGTDEADCEALIASLN